MRAALVQAAATASRWRTGVLTVITPVALPIPDNPVLLNTGRLAEGTQDARRSLAMARDLGYRTGEGIALSKLAIAASMAVTATAPSG